MTNDKEASGAVANDRKGVSVEAKRSLAETSGVRIPPRPLELVPVIEACFSVISPSPFPLWPDGRLH